MDRNLYRKVVVITNVACEFGRGCALEFAKLRATLVLAARKEQAQQGLVADCAKLGGRAVFVATDAADPNQIRDLYNEAIACFGQIDVWINNAGTSASGAFFDTPLEAHLKVIDTDMAGTMCGSHFALKHFRKRGKGTLINVASIGSPAPQSFHASFTAAKYGILGLSAAIRKELEEMKLGDIHVCTVLPKSIDNADLENAFNRTNNVQVPCSEVQDTIEAIVDLAFTPKAEVSICTHAESFNTTDSYLPGQTIV